MNFQDHAPAHFHAWYGDYKIMVSIKDGVVKGEMPGRALRMVLEWLDLHRDELLENWERAQNGDMVKHIVLICGIISRVLIVNFVSFATFGCKVTVFFRYMQIFLCFSQKFVLRTHISTHFQGSYCFRGAKVQQFLGIGEVLVMSYFKTTDWRPPLLPAT